MFREKASRQPQDDFKTEGSLPLRVKSTKRVTCNDNWRIQGSDLFELTLSVVNLDSSKGLVLMECMISYILRGDKDSQWKKVDGISGAEFPLKIEAGGVVHLALRVKVVSERMEKASSSLIFFFLFSFFFFGGCQHLSSPACRTDGTSAM